MQPIAIRRRMHWELLAVLSGRAAPLLPGQDTRLQGPTLWIFPPRHPHGWTGDAQGCRVCVIHIAAVSQVIARSAVERGHLAIPLDRHAGQTIERDFTTATALLRRDPRCAEIATDLLRGRFCSVAAAALDRLGPHSPTGRNAERTVKEALLWFDQHLQYGVDVAQVAQAMDLSPAHFRRLAHRVAGRSPRSLLQEARLNRARDLLRQEDVPLEDIAHACGYGSAVALSQAFHRATGMRPGAWRRAHG